MRYMIPRNVKKGQSFMGLELKGWLLLAATAPIFILLGWGCYQVTGNGMAGIMIAAIPSGLLYYLFTVDERTGAMNVIFLVEMFRWMRAAKIQYLWEDQYDEKIATIQVRVNFKRREKEE
jgi:hypothetical protein